MPDTLSLPPSPPLLLPAASLRAGQQVSPQADGGRHAGGAGRHAHCSRKRQPRAGCRAGGREGLPHGRHPRPGCPSSTRKGRVHPRIAGTRIGRDTEFRSDAPGGACGHPRRPHGLGLQPWGLPCRRHPRSAPPETRPAAPAGAPARPRWSLLALRLVVRRRPSRPLSPLAALSRRRPGRRPVEGTRAHRR